MKVASINWQVSIRDVTHRRKEALHGVWIVAVDRPQHHMIRRSRGVVRHITVRPSGTVGGVSKRKYPSTSSVTPRGLPVASARASTLSTAVRRCGSAW